MFCNRFLLVIVLIALAGRPACAGFVEFPEIDASMSGNRVVLTVYDSDDKTTRTWKSEEYEGVSEIENTDGIVAYYFTKDGWYYVKLAVYDPGDRKFHRWQSRLSNAVSSIDISGGVAAWIDDYWNCVEALAYDPSDRDWHEYRGPAFTGIDDMINDSGIVAFSESNFRVVIAAAYDLEDNKWRSCQFGPSMSGLISWFDNIDGVVAVLAGTNVSAAAYDIGDNKWHLRNDLTRVDTDPVNEDAIVAFARDRTVYSLAYDAHDRDWKYWSYYASGLIDDVDVENGYVIYTVKNIDYSRFSARKPRASFETVKSSRADSMLYHFADTSFGAITNWSWDFGDGSKSTERSPVHTYKKIGDHTITLKVTGPGGTHSVSRDIFLTSPTYTVTYSAGAGGTIAGAATQTIPYGHDGTSVTAVAATGYHFVSWSDDSTDAARREETVKSSMALSATFAINQYTVTFKTDGTIGASITGTTPQTVNHGASCTSVKAVAPTSRRFTGWKSGNTLYSSSSTITVTNVKSNMTLTATFSTGAAAETWARYQ